MVDCTCKPTLSPWALRYVRAYKPRFRNLMLKFLREKQSEHGTLCIGDIQQCIAMVFDVMEDDMSLRVALPDPDTKTMETAIEDYRAGRKRTIQDILNAVP